MKEMIEKYVGKRARVGVPNGLEIEVIITDYKKTFNRDRYLVTPVAGKGETWVETVKLIEGNNVKK